MPCETGSNFRRALRRLLPGVLLVMSLTGEGAQNPFAGLADVRLPPASFDETTPPPEPDYGDPANWAALPGRPDASDVAPAGVEVVDPASAKADVFFIHPTTMLSGAAWNQDLADAATNQWTDIAPIYGQASVFNGACRVYAPRYRQSSAAAQIIYTPDSVKARALAYSDILRAFRYYLDRYNEGRPFIIASHSQGSRHSLRFLPEVIDGTPLMKQFVAAYTIGTWIPESWFDAMKEIRICERADDTGCVATWSALGEKANADAQRKAYASRDGRPPEFAEQPFVCINPLTWSRAPGLAPPGLNLGGWTRGGSNIPRPPDPALVSARCDNGAVFVSEPQVPGYTNAMLPGDNYHNYDYGLFYMNIRGNVATRIEAFLSGT